MTLSRKPNTQAKSPLHNAAKAGQIARVKKLLKKTHDLSLKDNNGNTAVDIAIENNYFDITALLIEHSIPAETDPRQHCLIGITAWLAATQLFINHQHYISAKKSHQKIADLFEAIDNRDDDENRRYANTLEAYVTQILPCLPEDEKPTREIYIELAKKIIQIHSLIENKTESDKRTACYMRHNLGEIYRFMGKTEEAITAYCDFINGLKTLNPVESARIYGRTSKTLTSLSHCFTKNTHAAIFFQLIAKYFQEDALDGDSLICLLASFSQKAETSAYLAGINAIDLLLYFQRIDALPSPSLKEFLSIESNQSLLNQTLIVLESKILKIKIQNEPKSTLTFFQPNEANANSPRSLQEERDTTRPFSLNIISH